LAGFEVLFPCISKVADACGLLSAFSLTDNSIETIIGEGCACVLNVKTPKSAKIMTVIFVFIRLKFFMNYPSLLKQTDGEEKGCGK
jgi:hypothetical protein